MTDVEKCEINVTVGNGQKMKCELKGSIYMKLKYRQTVKICRIIVRYPRSEKPFDRIKDYLKGSHDGGHTG